MLHHIIHWKLKDVSIEEKAHCAAEMKRRLEALVGVVPGLLSLVVLTQPLPSSNVDVTLVSTLADEAALALYKDHPAHVEAATFVRSVVAERHCMDALA